MPIVQPANAVTTSLLKRQPVWYLHAIEAFLWAVGAIVLNSIGTVPADANWGIVVAALLRTTFAYLTHTQVFSQATIASLLKRLGLSNAVVVDVLANALQASLPKVTATSSPVSTPNALSISPDPSPQAGE